MFLMAEWHDQRISHVFPKIIFLSRRLSLYLKSLLSSAMRDTCRFLLCERWECDGEGTYCAFPQDFFSLVFFVSFFYGLVIPTSHEHFPYAVISLNLSGAEADF
ncbi:hypothetical protein LX32DRAFT_157257 [Colletotrichum zoysiae]|uniref:Uncharacterized protein n=1 Tax=Colletotrichum zoysiae TaxID=1216348 RepID=A0AAD9HPD0_9PEZI|nr:hypothetical protein LX32DRAFT_157257 [Colletotrichum zoysiae]